MIKVITHGEKKFQAVCPLCGCTFEYELEDTKKGEGVFSNTYYVTCPDCGETITRARYREYAYSPIDNAILTTTKNINELKYDPCETCPNRDGPKDAFGNPVVGDSPCQWCRHYKWRATW